MSEGILVEPPEVEGGPVPVLDLPAPPSWLRGPDLTGRVQWPDIDGWWPHGRREWTAVAVWCGMVAVEVDAWLGQLLAGALWVAVAWWVRLVLVWSWTGAWRGVRGVWRWVRRAKERAAQAELARAARATKDKATIDRLGRMYAQNEANIQCGPWPRLGITLAVAGMALVVLAAGWLVNPWWIAVAALIAAHVAGLAGIPESPAPITPPGVLIPAPRQRADMPMLMGALHAARLCRSPEGGDVRVVQDWTREPGGRYAVVDLPVPAQAAIKAAGTLATRLGTGEDMLLPETSREHAGRLTLRVLDRPPYSPGSRIPRAPLTRMGRVSVWSPLPVGFDPWGRPVTIDLTAETPGGVVAGMAGAGKSVLGTGFLGWCALDPSCRLWLVDGGADTRPWHPLAERTVGADHDGVVAMLRDLQAEMDRRISLLPSLARPDGSGRGVTKITRAVVDANPDHDLNMIVCWVDEAGLYTTGPKAAEITQLMQDLSGRLRKAGGRVFLATTEIDAQTLPKPITRNLGWRLALRCQSGTQSRMVTGLEAADGWDASRIDPATPGVAYLVGPTGRRVLRSWEYSPVEVDSIAAEARRRREEAGTLPSSRPVEASTPLIPAPRSSGETLSVEVPSILTRTLDVMGEVRRLHSHEIASRLGDGWDPVRLGTELAAAGYSTIRFRSPCCPSGPQSGVLRSALIEHLQGVHSG